VDAVSLHTDRLILRPWRPEDRAPFAELNADPEVMRHFPSVLAATDSASLADRIDACFAQDGWGLWAVEVPDVAPFIGFVGLAHADRVLGRPCIEVGWRLASAHWGRGYAPEAARECLRFGFDELGLPEVVSFTVPANRPSRRVMEKIGLELMLEFDHPALPIGDPLRRHVLYGMTADDWRT
jgi:RimJ/RimL family protein N-acetyltransferase